MTKLRPFCITSTFITERKPINTQFSVMVAGAEPEWRFQFQKQVIIKTPVKNDQVMALLYNCCFCYWKEAHKYPVLCSEHMGGSGMSFPIPKIGYNKNSSKNWSSYDPFL